MYLRAAVMGIRTRIIQIGNSRGIRLAKPILEQAGIEDEVELKVEDGQITILSITRPRQDWEERILTSGAAGDEGLLLPDVESERDKKNWVWEE